MSAKSGWRHGLRLELFAGRQSTTIGYKSGFRLVVHNQTRRLAQLDESGIDITTGKQTNVVVRRTFLKRVGDCVESTTLSNQQYQQDICILMCQQQQQEQELKNLTEQLECLLAAEKEHATEANRQQQQNKCISSCPLECDQINYELIISTADYPTNWYL